MSEITISEAFAQADAHFQARRFAEAAHLCRAIVEAQPAVHAAWRLRGLAAYSLGNLDEAAECLTRALELAPQEAEYHDNFGIIRAAQGRFEEAEHASRRALRMAPGLYQAAGNVGAALKAQRRLDEAETLFREVLAAAPDYVPALSNLGAVLAERGRAEEAEALCRRALERDPTYVEARVNLGLALHRQHRFVEAEACYRQSIGPDAAHAVILDNLGTALLAQGRVAEARQEHLRALALRPDFAAAHSHALMCLQYMPGVGEGDMAAAHAEWNRAHAARWAAAPAPPSHGDPERPLRLGLVSADFGQHPVGRFLVRVLENLDRGQCEVFCYSDRIGSDAITQRLRAASRHWYDSGSFSDAVLARQIAADHVDVLFDLAGHTAHNRLLVFARRPAPLQMSWIGYPGTTGLAAIDCLVADRFQVPDASLPHYREQVLRLAQGSVCYDPPADAPEVGPLPALAAGHVTFGSFSNPAKINRSVITVWADILRQVAGSRLVMKYNGFDDQSTRARYLREFEQSGIEPGRVDLLGYSPPSEMPVEYGRIDIGLDPFPYSGGLTTCEALWMGVPVITCPGQTFAGRHATAHLACAGLEEFVAGDRAHYVRLAIELAATPERLARLRAGLRAQVARSPLCDGRRLADEFLSALRSVWRERSGRAAR